MRLNILFGGEAGQGPNILTHILGEALVKQGYYVFYSRDYQSLIRGGHNFNVLTFSDEPVNSNDSKIDVLVALDKNTKKIHKKNLKKNKIILEGQHENMYFAGKLFKILGFDFKILEKELKKLKKRFDENIKEAKKGYADAQKQIELEKPIRKKFVKFANGNQMISQGAIKSELDFYYAYPMTPATSVLRELAGKQLENDFLTFELENEIAVINSAIGSAITGARTMVGTSGGGFDLMTESISLTGMINIPLVIFLAQRPGPATGVATYTSQGDLNTARCAGHGEFPRLLVAPGDLKESEELTNQAFYFAEKYKIPSIIINDKHLGESCYTTTEIPKIIKIKKSTIPARHSGNETDENEITSSKAEIIKKRVEERMKKINEIRKESKKFETYKIYGNKKSRNLVVFWGSTKGAILDAIKGITPNSSKMSDDLKKSSGLQEANETSKRIKNSHVSLAKLSKNEPSEGAILDAMKNLDCKALQILYLKPFPIEVKKELENKNLILIENNATGQLGDLISEKTGIFIKNKILRYDGRPFLCDELRKEIGRKLGGS